MGSETSDDRRAGWGPLAMVVLVLSVLFGTGAPSNRGGDAAGKGASKDAAGPAATASTPMASDFRRPYEEFRWSSGVPGPTRETTSSTSPPPTEKMTPSTSSSSLEPEKAARELGTLIADDALAGRVAPEFLIATVPDPLDTRFAYRFDGVVDALRLGAVARGWTFDRFWLPWWPSGRQFGDRSELRIPADERAGAPHVRQPGVLTFRKSGEAGRPTPLLIVWLVGETPTSGVAKEAFTTSLRVIGAYHDRLDARAASRPDAPGPARVVRLVAPMYSGSQTSIEQAIGGWVATERAAPARPWTIRLRSGAANSLDFDRLTARIRARSPDTRVEADTTLIPYETVIRGLLDSLHHLNGGHDLGKVALLTESDTGFGQAVAEFERDDPRKVFGATVTTMPFPYQIAQVAVAYARGDGDGKDTRAIVRSSSRLSLPPGEHGQPREKVPLLSPATTTPIGEFSMAKLLETISAESYRYVGIVATDVRDIVFLSRLIRQYSPDVQIFVPGGDLLLGHPEFASEMRGTIVASTYPLFSPSQRWTPPFEGDDRRHVFTDETDQGTYNATVSLLAAPGDRRHYALDLFDYGLPFDALGDLPGVWQVEGGQAAAVARRPGAGVPSLWISVVGQRGLWPLRYLPSPGRLRGRPLLDATLPPLDPSREALVARLALLLPVFTWQWALLGGLLSLLGWVLFVQQSRATHAARGVAGCPAPHALFASWLPEARAGRASAAEALHREALIAFALLVFLLAYWAAVIEPSWTAFHLSAWPQFLRSDVFSAAPAGTFAVIAWAALTSLMAALTGLLLAFTLLRRAALWSRWSLPLALAALGVLAAAMLGLHRQADAAAAKARAAAAAAAVVEPHPTVAGSLSWVRLHVGASHSPAAEAGLALMLAVVAVGLVVVAVRTRGRARGDLAVLALVVLPAAAWLPALHRLLWRHQADRYEGLLRLERTLDFSSGVSPAIPITGLLLLTLAWVACQLRRYEKADQSWRNEQATGLDDYPVAITVAVRVVTATRGGAVAVRRFVLSGAGRLCLDLGVRFRPEEVDPPAPPGPDPAADPAPVAAAEHATEPRGRKARDRRRDHHHHRRDRDRDRDRQRRDPAQARATPGPKQAAAARRWRRAADAVRRFAADPEGGVLIRVGLWFERQAGAESDGASVGADPGLYRPARPRARVLVDELHDAYLCCAKLTRVMFPRPWAQRWPGLAAGGLGLLVAVRLWQQAVPGADFPGAATWLVLMWVWFLALSVMLALCRFALLWSGLAALLRGFARLPMARAYDRLPPAFTRVFGRYLDRDAPYTEALVVPVQQWARVVSLYERPGVAEALRAAYLNTPRRPDGPPEAAAARHDEAIARLTGRPEGTPPEEPREAAARLQQAFQDDCRSGRSMADLPTWRGLRNASRAGFDLLEPFWQTKPATVGFADRPDKPAQDDPEEFPGAAEADLRAWLRAAEELVALELITFVSQIGVQLKNLATYLAIAPIVLLLTVATYPFQPARLLQFTLWGLLLVVVAVVVSVYVAMERDVLLSRVAKTVPNSIAFDGQFLGSVLKFLIPLLTIALAQFPFFSDTINQWFEPIGRILK